MQRPREIIYPTFMKKSEAILMTTCHGCKGRINFQTIDNFKERIRDGRLKRVWIANTLVTFHAMCFIRFLNYNEDYYDARENEMEWRLLKKTTNDTFTCGYCKKIINSENLKKRVAEGSIKRVNTKDGWQTFHDKCFKKYCRETENWWVIKGKV